MPRRNYNAKAGRPRPTRQRQTYTGLLASLRELQTERRRGVR